MGTAAGGADGVPSSHWSPTWRRLITNALDRFAGDTTLAAFRSPRECVEYYQRYSNNPLTEIEQLLDEADAEVSAVVDQQGSEMWLSEMALSRGWTMAQAREAVITGELVPTRFVRVCDREYPRFRADGKAKPDRKAETERQPKFAGDTRLNRDAFLRDRRCPPLEKLDAEDIAWLLDHALTAEERAEFRATQRVQGDRPLGAVRLNALRASVAWADVTETL